MCNNHTAQTIDGDRVNQLLDEAILLFKQHEINLTDDLALTLELVECLAGFLEKKCLVKVTDQVNPYDAVCDILKQQEQVITVEGCALH